VFDLYVNMLGETVLDSWLDSSEPYQAEGVDGPVDCVDLVATRKSSDGAVVVAAVNKHAREDRLVTIRLAGFTGGVRVTTLSGGGTDDYNDVGFESRVVPFVNGQAAHLAPDGATVLLPAHSVNIVEFIPGV
jgi:alpha-L-arabinofuranosidase